MARYRSDHQILNMHRILALLALALTLTACQNTRPPAITTGPVLMQGFAYCFQTPPGSSYPPIFDLRDMTGPAAVEGAGGLLPFRPFRVTHGAITALGYRFGEIAYSPDLNHIPDEAWEILKGVKVWIVDCLQRKPHGSHAHLEMTLGWIERLKPERAILTNMHLDMDYRTLLGYLMGCVYCWYLVLFIFYFSLVAF